MSGDKAETLETFGLGDRYQISLMCNLLGTIGSCLPVGSKSTSNAVKTGVDMN